MPRCGVPRSVPVLVEVVHEPPERAFSDGCGLLVTAESSTGCVWGASGGARRVAACVAGGWARRVLPGGGESARRQGASLCCTACAVPSLACTPNPPAPLPPPPALRPLRAGLGERGVRAEDIGQRAGDEMMDALEAGACTDEWLQDQLVIFMALARVRSEGADRGLAAGGWG